TFDPVLRDRRIGKEERCIPNVLGTTGSTRIAQMRRDFFRQVGILHVEVARARCGTVARTVECNRREVKYAVPLGGRGEERRPGSNRGRSMLALSPSITYRCRRQELTVS